MFANRFIAHIASKAILTCNSNGQSLERKGGRSWSLNTTHGSCGTFLSNPSALLPRGAFTDVAAKTSNAKRMKNIVDEGKEKLSA
jgi:hypothetical protein